MMKIEGDILVPTYISMHEIFLSPSQTTPSRLVYVRLRDDFSMAGMHKSKYTPMLLFELLLEANNNDRVLSDSRVIVWVYTFASFTDSMDGNRGYVFPSKLYGEMFQSKKETRIFLYNNNFFIAHELSTLR